MNVYKRSYTYKVQLPKTGPHIFASSIDNNSWDDGRSESKTKVKPLITNPLHESHSEAPNKVEVMNNLVNKVQLIGRMGMNPEVRSLENNRKMARFSIATDESYKDSDGKKVENTQWHNIVAWGNTAEFVEKYLKKGQLLALEGKLVSSSYTDKEGNKRFSTDVHANEFMILSSKKEAVTE